MKVPAVKFNKEGPIALIQLNRPEQLNAFNVEMRDQLYDIISVICDDPTVEAAVIHGAGRGFCAGADLTEFGTDPPVIRKRRIRLQRDLWEEIRRVPKPIAAAMHGFAVGSGLEMAMLCDFRFASPGTKLALPEAQLGMIPAAGGTQSLPRLVHLGKALDFALGGYRITAEEGYELNIITQIFPEEKLLESAIDFMKNITKHSSQTSKWIKSLITHGIEMPLEQGLLWEQTIVARSWENEQQKVSGQRR